MSGGRTRPRHPSRDLIAAVLTVGVTGFGGGSALIPVFDREVVVRRGLLSPATYLRHTVVANLTPGALPVKLAAAAGVTIGGWRLSVLAALVVALPGVLGTIGLLALADALGPSAVHLISYASVGITAFIVVLLIGYISKVHAQAGRRLPLYVAITVTAALATGGEEIIRLVSRVAPLPWDWPLPRLGALALILVALAVIVLGSLLARRRSGSEHAEPGGPSVGRPIVLATAASAALAAAGMAVFLGWHPGEPEIGVLVAASAVSSFGGGEAYIGVADGLFVRSELVDRDAFYTQLVPIANALPGPILVKVAAGVGYIVGAPAGPLAAWALAGGATAASIGACCAAALPVLGAYERLRSHPVVVNIGRYILPVICGLLVSVCATMFHVSTDIAEGAGIQPGTFLTVLVLAVAVLTLLHLWTRVPDLLMLLVAGGASLCWLLVSGGG